MVCCGAADWINKTIMKKRIRQGPVISLCSEIHEDDNDLISFILEKSIIQKHKGLVITQRPDQGRSQWGGWGAERSPSRPFVGKFCSLVGIFVF